jgi:hypothetical protein
MIHIIGLGGVGFWLTVGLSRSVPPDQLTCWDNDTLAGGTGANRLPWAPASTPKIDLLRGFLMMTMGDQVFPQFHNTRFSGLSGLTAGDTVIDCTDMPMNTRKRMWQISRKRGASMIRVSYDGRGSMIVVSTGLPFLAPAEGGYAAVPSLALSLAAGGIGAEAVKRYLDCPVEHFTFSISVEELMK